MVEHKYLSIWQIKRKDGRYKHRFSESLLAMVRNIARVYPEACQGTADLKK